MKLVAYVRVSGNGQLDSYGPDAQRQAMKAWAKAHGHRIVAEHEDAITGASDALDREGLSDALAALRVGQAQGLIVARLDRLARALTVQEAVLALIWREHGHVFTADAGEVHQDDPDDPMRTAMRQMVGVFAELDRRMVVKRLRDGRTAKAATGRKVAGQYAFGFTGEGKGRARDAAPEPTEQAVVARIGQLRALGHSYRAIATTLDSEGLKPRRASSWSPMSVRNVALRAG